MHKTLIQMMALTFLFVAMGDYAMGETHEKVYTGCVAGNTFGTRKIKCTSMCNETYKRPSKGDVEENIVHCLSPDKPYTCLCTYFSPD